MKKIGLLIFAAALILGVVIAGFGSFGNYKFKSPVSFVFGSKIKGSGNVVTEKRRTAKFRGIEVGGIIHVEVTQSEKTSVTLEGDDNVLAHIKTEVDDGILEIKSKKKFRTRNRITLRISTPNLTSIDTSGVARVTYKGFTEKKVVVNSSGASKVALDGTVKKLEVDMSGASHIKASALKADHVAVDGSGASSVTVSALESLTADVSGASSVRYSGSPKLTKSTSGAGSVSKTD